MENTYEAKQMAARKIEGLAANPRWNNSKFDTAYDKLGRLLLEIQKAGGFAAAVAETVDSSMNPYANKVARVSSKQAWILGCALVENNIEF